jgi:hypothetical protein
VQRLTLDRVATSTERSRRRRARLRAALQPADDAPLRDTADLVEPAVRETLDALELAGADTAVARLALAHARVLDTARDPLYAARWHGPLLLDALTALGATPAARARLPKGEAPPGPSRLDALRASRASRRRP